jgi:hypothetical protein
MHEAREEGKKTKQELEALKERYAKLEGRTDALMQAFGGKDEPKEEVKPPSKDEDPFGYYEYKISELEAKNQKAEEWGKTFEEKQQEAQVFQSYQMSAKRFSEQRPDFQNAYQHAVNIFANMVIAESNGNETEEQLREQVQRREVEFAKNALKRGQDPAQAVYELAQRCGYQGTETPDASEKVKELSSKQGRHKSLSGGSGSAAPSRMTSKDLMEMSDQEFHAFSKKNPELVAKTLRVS